MFLFCLLQHLAPVRLALCVELRPPAVQRVVQLVALQSVPFQVEMRKKEPLQGLLLEVFPDANVRFAADGRVYFFARFTCQEFALSIPPLRYRALPRDGGSGTA